MSISWFRDLIICITGLVTTGVLIFIAVLLYSLYRRTKTMLDSMQPKGITSYIIDELLRSLLGMVTLAQGIRQGIESVIKFFKKREGGKHV